MNCVFRGEATASKIALAAAISSESSRRDEHRNSHLRRGAPDNVFAVEILTRRKSHESRHLGVAFGRDKEQQGCGVTAAPENDRELFVFGPRQCRRQIALGIDVSGTSAEFGYRRVAAAEHIAAGSLIDRKRAISRLGQARRDRGIFTLVRTGLMKQQDERLGVLCRIVIAEDLDAIVRLKRYRLDRFGEWGRGATSPRHRLGAIGRRGVARRRSEADHQSRQEPHTHHDLQQRYPALFGTQAPKVTFGIATLPAPPAIPFVSERVNKPNVKSGDRHGIRRPSGDLPQLHAEAFAGTLSH